MRLSLVFIKGYLLTRSACYNFCPFPFRLVVLESGLESILAGLGLGLGLEGSGLGLALGLETPGLGLGLGLGCWWTCYKSVPLRRSPPSI